MKEILVNKPHIILAIILLIVGCNTPKQKSTYQNIKLSIRNEDVKMLQSLSTQHFQAKIERFYGNLENSRNRNHLFEDLKQYLVYDNAEETDSTIYLFSNERNSHNTVNTLVIIHLDTGWYCDDLHFGR